MKDFEGFRDLIKNEVPLKYNLKLQGSWRNDEFHIIKSDGNWVSFSDVDYSSCGQIDIQLKEKIKKEINFFGEKFQVVHKGVSIHPVSEFQAMWETERCGRVISKKWREGFLPFWMLISFCVLCIDIAKEGGRSSLEEMYFRNKFYLTLWRDIGLQFYLNFSSHKSTLIFAKDYLPEEVCDASYRIKIGRPSEMEWDVIEAYHRSSLANLLDCCHLTKSQREHAAIIIEEAKNINSKSALQWFGNAFSWSSLYVNNLYGRKIAIARISNKTRQLIFA